MSENKNTKAKAKVNTSSYLALIACGVLCSIITFALYSQTKSILEGRLKERISSIVSTASIQFDVEELKKIQDESAVGTKEYEHVVRQLQSIRNYNKDLQYAYLLRPSEDPTIFHFIADADSIDPTAEIDLTKDGEITEDDALATPGDEYDASEIPAIVNEATRFVTTDAKPVVDQWGSSISAYAPIIEKGETIAILGIDVDVSDYLTLISTTFVPFALFIVFLLLLLTILTVLLVSVWRSRVDAVEELDRQKDELIGIVAHQLGKPITAMKWNLEMLSDGDIGVLQDDQQKSVKEMQTVGAHLSDLVSMLLDVSRIELGRMKLEALPLDLNSFFHEIITLIDPSAKERKIDFVKDMPATLPVALLDKRHMRMTVENLLSNAVKYTPVGGKVELKVSVKHGELYCHVRDTGCGIPKADQGKIFGKLYRASNVRNTVDGNGFGLYVAKGAIEGQGGKMWFESTEDKGTTFYFTLPIKEAPPASDQKTAA